MHYLKLPCNSLSRDTTRFHVDGDYEQDIDAKSITITRGYSRDHRPDLNQVVLNLITDNQAGIHGRLVEIEETSFDPYFSTPEIVYIVSSGDYSAPALAGIINTANRRATSTKDELNYIYGQAIKNYHSYWHDILNGNNGFPALVGYDFITGLGSPLGYLGK